MFDLRRTGDCLYHRLYLLYFIPNDDSFFIYFCKDRFQLGFQCEYFWKDFIEYFQNFLNVLHCFEFFYDDIGKQVTHLLVKGHYLAVDIYLGFKIIICWNNESFIAYHYSFCRYYKFKLDYFIHLIIFIESFDFIEAIYYFEFDYFRFKNKLNQLLIENLNVSHSFKIMKQFNLEIYQLFH